MQKDKKYRFVNDMLTVVSIFFFLSAIGVSFYTYYYTKEYTYLVEASCDPLIEPCFFRDCQSEPDSCPPNGLSLYKQFYVKGYEFQKCVDNSCKAECEQGTIFCENIPCGESEEDICVSEF